MLLHKPGVKILPSPLLLAVMIATESLHLIAMSSYVCLEIPLQLAKANLLGVLPGEGGSKGSNHEVCCCKTKVNLLTTE